MKIYSALDRMGLKKSYSSKFLFIAFVGTHIPLIGLVVLALMMPDGKMDLTTILLLVLGCTIIAAAATLLILNKLLSPIRLASKMVSTYNDSKIILEAPKNFEDEVGVLLKQLTMFFNKLDLVTIERNNFTGLITHDLRNPVSNIQGLASFIAENPQDPENIEYTKLIDESCEDCLHVISDVTRLLKAEEFSLEGKSLEIINLNHFVANEIGKLEIPLKKKAINVSLQIDKSEKLKVNKEFFSHIIHNLITNAIKFTPKGGKIEIRSNTNNEDFQLIIEDNGVGFDPNKANQLFERFTPLKRTGTEDEPTTGLGLFLTKMLVEKHGGKIFASSQGNGKGATFTIKLQESLYLS